MKILTREQLEALTTKRLLAYKNKLLKCHDEPASCSELAKSSPEWQELYATCKEILATREHVE